jgi:hypothetical protein
MHDFIEVYDGALSDDFCEKIINKYENTYKDHIENSSERYGVKGMGEKVKDSMDLGIHVFPEWKEELHQIQEITTQYLVQYVKKYSHFLFTILGNKMIDKETGVKIELTDELISTLPNSMVASLIHMQHQHSGMNVQKYLKGKGGFTHTHKGNVPISDDKYIIASWFQFKPFQMLQQQQQ